METTGSSSSAMASRLSSSLLSKRLSSIAAFSSSVAPLAALASHSTAVGGTASSSSTASPRHKKKATPVPATTPRLRRTLSMPCSERDLRLDIFFHVPGFSELQRLRAHRSLSLISLQAMLQREFGVPFEDQRLYFQGDLLEGDEELASYDIQDRSVINVRTVKRYRRIGDVFTKIKVIRFPVAEVGNVGPDAPKTLNLHHDDYELIEVVAALPPLPIVLRRLGIAIAYITMLDRMQQKRTNRRVWRERMNVWEEPVDAATLNINDAAKSRAQDEPASFVVRKCSPHRASSLVAIAHGHIHERLRVTPESRSAADVRHIRKWLGGVRYFASANMPDAALHEVARSCVYERHRAGDFIFRQGDVGDFFYILISGCVSLAAYGNGYFATMTPGMCFGEISLFEARGVRTASANVTFAAAFAELAVLSGDVYRRVINPHKQAVLHRTEKAVYSVPQLRRLPDTIITHIAYAGKCLTAKTGKRLVRHGDDVNVLVLLVAGAVKVSTPRPKQQHQATSAKFKPCFNQERTEKPFPIVSVVHAPAVFGQEGCLANTRRAAPWDIDALDTCSLVCLRADTLSIFLAPRQDIVRALVAEHQTRIEDFRRRFEQHARAQESRRSSAASSGHKNASYLRLLSSSTRRLLGDANSLGESRFDGSPRMRTASRVEFPKVLMKDAHIAALEASPTLLDLRSPRAPTSSDAAHQSKRSALRNFFFFGSRTKATSEEQPTSRLSPPRSAPTCAELQDQFLHHALPHGNMLELREQIQFVSFAQQQADWDRQRSRPETGNVQVAEEPLEAKTRALLTGLRKLPAEDVEMAVPHSRDQQQFQFVSASS